jgi:dipeptidyl aminopeptidase/acylaminoacyl peptidase
VTVGNAVSPGDVHLLRGNALTQLTRHYNYLQDTFLLPRQERVVWKGEDGVEVEGLLSYPLDYEPGKRYPLVTQTHGGPASADHYGLGTGPTRYHPVLAANGYAIFLPNYRGSTGYGDAFLRDMVGGYFRQSHLDVMTGIDHLIAKGIADPDRLIKMGWSAGGHMTNKLITFTDRFKAASSGAGAVNWIGMYAQSDVRTYRTPWFGGTPWQENAPIDNYWNNSPLKDIAKAKTPTLVFVGEQDVRVPLMQSVELYRALKSLNVPTHLHVAPREPHGWGELRHRLHKINKELGWFAKYGLGKGYVEEEAP